MDRAGDGGGAQRRDGFNAGRRVTDAPTRGRHARAPAGLMTRGEPESSSPSLRSVRVALEVGPICFVLSPSRWRSCSGTRWRSASPRTRSCSGLAMAVAPVGGWLAAGGRPEWSPGCSPRHRHLGRGFRRIYRAGSDVRSRAWPAIDSVPSAWRGRCSSRAHARDTVGCLAPGAARAPGRHLLAGVAAWLCCSCTSVARERARPVTSNARSI